MKLVVGVSGRQVLGLPSSPGTASSPFSRSSGWLESPADSGRPVCSEATWRISPSRALWERLASLTPRWLALATIAFSCNVGGNFFFSPKSSPHSTREKNCKASWTIVVRVTVRLSPSPLVDQRLSHTVFLRPSSAPPWHFACCLVFSYLLVPLSLPIIASASGRPLNRWQIMSMMIPFFKNK